MRFFADVREALFAGYRACLRCDPLGAYGRQPQWVTRLLKALAADPTRRFKDADLRKAGLEPARVRRYFLKHYDMTFHAYARGRRLSGAFQQLRQGVQLDEVAMGTGFESHSGFRDAFARTFGQAPGRSRTGDHVVCAWIESPLGPLVAGATARGICLLEFTDRRMLPAQVETVRRRFDSAVVPGESPYFDQLRDELKAYFSGQLRQFSLPLVAPGTPFQERVWAELQRIPFGETRSYEDLARAVGTPSAQRAVGRANGMNRIAIVIPCHRVINKDGRLGGYGRVALAEGSAPASRAHRTARTRLAVFRNRSGAYANPSSSMRRSKRASERIGSNRGSTARFVKAGLASTVARSRAANAASRSPRPTYASAR